MLVVVVDWNLLFENVVGFLWVLLVRDENDAIIFCGRCTTRIGIDLDLVVRGGGGGEV